MSAASYPDLLREAQPQIIHDKKTHQRALARVDLLGGEKGSGVIVYDSRPLFSSFKRRSR